MKKIITGVALSIVATAAIAQETYESAQLSTQDLNGTARYIGMGGAMEALGADISTISSNPAGIGLFRRSWIGISGGLTVQSASYDNNGLGSLGVKMNDNGVTNADLNQLGFVYTTRTKEDSWFNMAFNYSKSRNFNQITNAINSLDDASVNKMTYMRLSSLNMDRIGGTASWIAGNDPRWSYMSMLDDLNATAIQDQFPGEYTDNDGSKYWADDYMPATAYCGQRNTHGYISNFDFNFSGNLHNKIFLGITFGMKDVHYHSAYYYDETLEDSEGNTGLYGLTDSRHITGSGFDVKAGIIVRPIEDSGFRFGAYIHTPTWYTLNCYGNMSTAASDLWMNSTDYAYGNQYTYDYKYKIITPWKFGFSLGHTIEDKVAIGATYEYADYSTIKNKIYDGVSYDYYEDYWGGYGDEYEMYEHDTQMNENTEETLKGVSTLKVGVEVKPVPEVAIRLGYNWVSPMYNENGSKDFSIDANPQYGSIGSYYSTYDYVNWKDTHRITFGLGFKISKDASIDIAYQYSTQKGDYHPFQNIYNLNTYGVNYTADASGNVAFERSFSPESIYGTSTTVKNNRHQISCTLGVKF